MMVCAVFAPCVAACGGADGGGGEALVGSWGGPEAMLTFHADSTFDWVQGEDEDDMRSGTWEVDGDQLTTRGLSTEVESMTFGYVVFGDQLLTAAMFPEGATTGVLGTWHGVVIRDEVVRDTTFVIDAGGTGHVVETETVTGMNVDADLTWEVNDGILSVDWGTGFASRGVILDVALGGIPMPRVAP